jgi:hypothetical protein
VTCEGATKLAEMATNWSADLLGFQERSYEETKTNLEVVGTTLRSRVNHRSFSIGELETPSLMELRNRAASVVGRLAGTLKVSNVSGDVRRMHHDPANRHALFQVASQFNLLEMAGPHLTPEDGVTRYIDDHTQGPACALAAAAATVYWNYFVPVDGHVGQTRDRQVDCLRDVGTALDNAWDRLWTMRNGYALCTANGLATIAQRLEAFDASEVDDLRDRIRIGLHSGVQVTDADDAEFVVSQAFCSALPISYTDIPAARWRSSVMSCSNLSSSATLRSTLSTRDTQKRVNPTRWNRSHGIP